MKNSIVCKNCNTENPFYGLTCKNCKAYLRERVFNIDLWKTIGLLAENPVKAFRTIIFAEHKNFIILILFLSAGMFVVNAKQISLLEIFSPLEGNFLLIYLLTFAIITALICLYALGLKFINNRFSLQTRWKDNTAMLIYSLIPHSFAIVILFPIEIVIFGGYIFSTNPSPFLLKETVAYILLCFEALIILWSLILSIVAIYTQTRNKLFSVAAGLLFQVIIWGILILLPLITKS